MSNVEYVGYATRRANALRSEAVVATSLKRPDISQMLRSAAQMYISQAKIYRSMVK